MKLVLFLILGIWIIFDALKVKKDIDTDTGSPAVDVFLAFPIAVFAFVKKLVSKKPVAK